MECGSTQMSIGVIGLTVTLEHFTECQLSKQLSNCNNTKLIHVTNVHGYDNSSTMNKEDT